MIGAPHDLSAIRPVDARQNLEQRRLARAVAAHQSRGSRLAGASKLDIVQHAQSRKRRGRKKRERVLPDRVPRRHRNAERLCDTGRFEDRHRLDVLRRARAEAAEDDDTDSENRRRLGRPEHVRFQRRNRPVDQNGARELDDRRRRPAGTSSKWKALRNDRQRVDDRRNEETGLGRRRPRPDSDRDSAGTARWRRARSRSR